MSIHAFGAYFGLTVSLILSSKIKPVARASSSYSSNITALIGTLFLWLYWPSFNFGVAAETQFEQNQIVINTLLSLTGSVLSTFVVTSVAGHGLGMDDILNATLAGGVAVGSASGLLYSPAFALSIGIIAGIISTFGFKYLTPILEHKIGLFDTCGINNLHGIPGVLGGLFSAIIVAAYSWGYDKNVASQYGPHNIFQSVHGSFWHQSLLQVAGTFTSVGFGILFGFIAGKIISVFYR
jgi:ammonium transporter Rh